jgi:acyl-CoA reductase-like NAD-dependent aldehyde dehydrogenase
MTHDSIQLPATATALRQSNDLPSATTLAWAQVSLPNRIARVCALRHVLAADPQPWIDAIQVPFRNGAEETLAAEIIPLADACRFLENIAPRLLRPRRLGRRGRPLWLLGVDAEIHREPLGTVLIIGPGNYPLMIPGIGAVQALVAGNRVLLKPAPGTRPVLKLLAESLHRLGVPRDACIVLDESPEVIKPLLGEVNKVILTGSAETGRTVARDLAPHLLPSVMELSGRDSAIVLADADVDLAARCLRFGLAFNGSNSCIAPRRIFVDASIADELIAKVPGIENIVRMRSVVEAIDATNRHPYRLGASIFGSITQARAVAAQLNVGSVVINDLIVPTADPRLPFGGRGESGFGVTRGAEGLLEMTAVKTISTRRRGPRLHLMPANANTPLILAGQLAASHSKTLAGRIVGLFRLIGAARRHRDSRSISAKDSLQ